MSNNYKKRFEPQPKKNTPKMKARRVLHVLRSVEGGVPIVVDQLANGLDRKRYEAIILFDTYRQSEIRKKLLQSKIEVIDFKKCSDTQTSSLPKSHKNLNISKRLESRFGREANRIYLSTKAFSIFLNKQAPKIFSYVRAIQQNKIDIVHTHNNLYHGKPEIIAAWLSGIPCISHNHGYREFNYFDKMFARFVDTFVNISRDVAEYYALQGETRFKGIIIHNGIDVSKFTRQYNLNSVREEFGIKPAQTLVGIISRIDWWKGHEYFLEAMAAATKQISNLRGLIVGGLEEYSNSTLNRNKRYFQKLKNLVNSFDLSDKVIFAGSRNDVPRLMSGMDMVVHASSNPEPFGLVIIEAMAAGKPVIATAAGGVLDIIVDGTNGLLVPCRDAEAIARAIIQIVSNPDRARQMGMAARRCVDERFSIQQQVMSVQKLYDDLLANPQRRKKFQD